MTPHLETQPELKAELTLELARLAQEPRSTDKMRNLEALRQRLGLPTAAPSVPPAALPQHAPTPVNPSPPTLALAPWQQLLGVGIVTGALGFFLGLNLDRAPTPLAATSGAPAPALATTAFAAATSSSAASSSAPTSTAASPPEQLPGEPHPRLTPVATLAPASHPLAAHGPRARSTPRHAKTTPAHATEPSTPEFLEAVQLLGRARRALDRGEPALALALLDELDTRFPRDLLDEERSATRVLGLCASGETDAAAQLAQRAFSGSPRSIYTRRLEHSCAASALVPRPKD